MTRNLRLLVSLSLLLSPVSALAEECSDAEEICETRCLNPLEGSDERSNVEACLIACEAQANACRAPAQE